MFLAVTSHEKQGGEGEEKCGNARPVFDTKLKVSPTLHAGERVPMKISEE